jgi:hypothetical protein
VNGNNPGPLAAGRREINWDGGGSTATSPGGTPFTVFFNSRGAFIETPTPGTGFVQVPVTDNDPLNGLADIADFYGNPTYDGQFSAFSPVRVFNPISSNITDVTFVIPGSVDPVTQIGVQATVGGFGAVFSDVDLATSTELQFYNVFGNLIFSEFVLPGTVPDGSLSFLGGIGNSGERIARVRLITGNAALDATTNEVGDVDLVVMDDFLYAEPKEVTEPATFGLVALGLAALSRRVRRARQR